MEKILVLQDAKKYNRQLIEFAAYLAVLTKSGLTGYFLEEFAGQTVPVQKQLFALPYVETITAGDIPENRDKGILYESNKKLFCEACMNQGISYQFRASRNPSLEDLLMESRYADLMVLEPESNMVTGSNGSTPHLVQRFINRAECPLVVAPYSFYGVEEIIFAYDGTASGVRAIKQFVHLFPQFNQLKLTVLSADGGVLVPDGNIGKMNDLLMTHYSSISFYQLQGKESDELFGYLLEKERALIVTGAIGRDDFSAFFKSATTGLMMKMLNLPIFIAN